jgi:hypothetical protein
MSKDPPSLKRSVDKVNWTMGLTAKKSWIDSPELQVILSLLQNVQSGSGGHLTSHSKHNWGTSIGHETDHSFSPSAEIKNKWNYTASPPVGLHGVHSYSFTTYLHTKQTHCTDYTEIANTERYYSFTNTFIETT